MGRPKKQTEIKKKSIELVQDKEGLFELKYDGEFLPIDIVKTIIDEVSRTYKEQEQRKLDRLKEIEELTIKTIDETNKFMDSYKFYKAMALAFASSTVVILIALLKTRGVI